MPVTLEDGQWHLPLTDDRDADVDIDEKIMLSIARCARVSYLTHDGVRSPEKDIKLFDQLIGNRHLSPMEHAASPALGRHGNLMGWRSYRCDIPHESGEE